MLTFRYSRRVKIKLYREDFQGAVGSGNPPETKGIFADRKHEEYESPSGMEASL